MARARRFRPSTAPKAASESGARVVLILGIESHNPQEALRGPYLSLTYIKLKWTRVEVGKETIEMEIVRNYKQGQNSSAILRNTGASCPRL